MNPSRAAAQPKEDETEPCTRTATANGKCAMHPDEITDTIVTLIERALP